MTDIPPPAKQRRADLLAGEREGERLAPGSYFAEHKAVIDARREPLARLGMDARHVDALRMPARYEAPIKVDGTPALEMVKPTGEMALQDDSPDEIPAAYSPKRPPPRSIALSDVEE